MLAAGVGQHQPVEVGRSNLILCLRIYLVYQIHVSLGIIFDRNFNRPDFDEPQLERYSPVPKFLHCAGTLLAIQSHRC